MKAKGAVENDPKKSEHLVWYVRRRGVYMQTPLVIGDLLYACADNGALGCYDAKTGSKHYRERLGGGKTGFSASGVASGGHLYYFGESGDVSVVKVSREFELVAENSMGEECMASPAIVDGIIYCRTRHHLVAIGKKK